MSVHRYTCTNVQIYKCIINSRPFCLPSGAHFPSVQTIFKTALVSVIFILELSVLHKVAYNSIPKRTESFPESRASPFSYVRALPVFNIEYSNFLNIHLRKKFL